MHSCGRSLCEIGLALSLGGWVKVSTFLLIVYPVSISRFPTPKRVQCTPTQNSCLGRIGKNLGQDWKKLL